jgi:hypothetical protein
MSYGIELSQNDDLTLLTSSSVIFFSVGFVLFCRRRAIQRAVSPLLFFFFMVLAALHLAREYPCDIKAQVVRGRSIMYEYNAKNE